MRPTGARGTSGGRARRASDPPPDVTRRRFVALCGAALAASCAVRRRDPGPGPDEVAAPDEVATAAAGRGAPLAIPLVYDPSGGLFVEARVDGRAAVRMILDTGAMRSTISSAYAAELGLALSPGAPVEGSAGVVASEEARATVELAGLGAFAVDFVVYGFASYDPACVGILGHELLSRAPFAVRYRGRELAWNAPAPAATIAMSVDDRIPRIAARANGVELALRIDTGAALAPGDDAYVNLTRAQAFAVGLTGRPAKVFGATGTGGARLELPVHRLDSLEVAGRTLSPAWAIVQPEVGAFARPDAVGFLGNAALDKLDPWFDYAAGRFGITRTG